MTTRKFDPQLVQEAWNEVAGGYETYWCPRFLPFVEEALAAFEPAEEGPLAVPGCGPGQEVLLLAERYSRRRIVATDPAEAMIERLKLRLKGYPKVEPSVGMAEELSASVEQAGGIFCSFTLQLLADPAAVLADWAGALAPGAPIVCLFWPRQDLDSPWGRMRSSIEQGTGRLVKPFEPALKRKLPSLGLELVREETLTRVILHPSPQEAWWQLVEAGPLQVLKRRLADDEKLDACRDDWLATHGMQDLQIGWGQPAKARLWVLRRAGESPPAP